MITWVNWPLYHSPFTLWRSGGLEDSSQVPPTSQGACGQSADSLASFLLQGCPPRLSHTLLRADLTRRGRKAQRFSWWHNDHSGHHSLQISPQFCRVCIASWLLPLPPILSQVMISKKYLHPKPHLNIFQRTQPFSMDGCQKTKGVKWGFTGWTPRCQAGK